MHTLFSATSDLISRSIRVTAYLQAAGAIISKASIEDSESRCQDAGFTGLLVLRFVVSTRFTYDQVSTLDACLLRTLSVIFGSWSHSPSSTILSMLKEICLDVVDLIQMRVLAGCRPTGSLMFEIVKEFQSPKTLSSPKSLKVKLFCRYYQSFQHPWRCCDLIMILL